MKKPPAFSGICNAAVKHSRICNPEIRKCGNYKLPNAWSGIANAAQPQILLNRRANEVY
jgi:hypothetical protein